MTTKTLKIKIVKPLDTDWKEFGEILKDIQYDSWKLSNKMIQGLWEFNNENFKYKERTGNYIDLKKDRLLFKDLGNSKKYYTNVLSDIKNLLKKEAYKLSSRGYQALGKMVNDSWNIHYQDIVNGRESIINFKKNLPIELHNLQMMNNITKELTLKKQDIKGKDWYEISFNLISKTYSKELGYKNGWFRVALDVRDNYQKAIVDRVISKEYKLSMSKLTQDKKGNWYFMMAYTFEPKKKELNKERIMGIDLGVNIPAVIAINDDNYYKQNVGSRKEIQDFEKQVIARKKSLQNQRKHCGDGSIGRGIKTRLKPLDKIGNKISNFKNTKNHCWSRYIVDEAVKNECGVIQMEDLSGISDNNKFLKTWTYYDLQQKIAYKAKEVGIDIKMIKPSHTSARCSKCGHIHKKEDKPLWRPTQEQFKCMNCDYGHRRFVNADFNASKNIATKDIEKIIEKQLKEQKKKENINLKKNYDLVEENM
jgi:IS605 OrfB family transposase